MSGKKRPAGTLSAVETAAPVKMFIVPWNNQALRVGSAIQIISTSAPSQSLCLAPIVGLPVTIQHTSPGTSQTVASASKAATKKMPTKLPTKNAIKPPSGAKNSIINTLDQMSNAGKTSTKRKSVFSKEIRCMLYGFGDHQDSYTETVDLVEDLVMKFITDVTLRAYNFGANDRVTIQDLMFVLRKDAKKFTRLKELMDMSQELREARKAFDEVNYVEQTE